MSEYRKLLLHGAIYAAGALLARVVSFVMMPVYTRALSPAEYGVVDLLDTTAAVMVNLANVAITYSVMRFYYDEDTQRARGRVIATALAGLALFGFVAVAAFWPIAPRLAAALFGGERYTTALRLMTITAMLYSLIEVPMTYLRARERPGLYLAVSIGRLLLGLALNVVFVVLLRWGVLGVVYANVLTSAATALGLLAYTLPQTGLACSRRILRGMLAFGAPFIPGSLAMLVLHNGDRYILNHFRPLQDVGIYSLGYKLGMIITYALSVPFSNVWSTRMYTIVDEPDGDRAYARVGTYYVYGLLLAWVLLSACARDVVAVAASPEFAGAAAIVPVVAGGYILRETSEFWKNAFLIRKQTRTLAWLQPATACANLVLTWWLARAFGAQGAAWATLLTFALLLGLTGVLAERVLPTRISVRWLAVAAGLAVTLYLAARVLPPMPLALALGVKLLLALALPVALFALHAVPDEDRAAALELLRGLRRRLGRADPRRPARRSLHP